MNYLDRMRQRAFELRGKPGLKILAIETSCDETAAAVILDGKTVLSNCVYSQIDLHAIYGGVVPEIASRAHVEKIAVVVKAALDEAHVGFEGIDAIAVTYGPGLVGALLVGVSYAKALAAALDKPLIAVNHIEGHICANYLSHSELEPPYLCLVVSGGHSHLIRVEEGDKYRMIGCTQDDAAGEAFDKAARVLKLPYPGGPKLDKEAELGNDRAFDLPRPHTEGQYDYSFSGLKTAFINLTHRMGQRGEDLPVQDLAACFRKAVVDQLIEKCMLAAQGMDQKRVALAGGVSANSLLRRRMREECRAKGIELYLPDLIYTGDNAAMIGAAAFRRLMHLEVAGLDLNANPSLRLV